MPEPPRVQDGPQNFERVFDSTWVRVVVSIGAVLTAALLLGFKEKITSSWPLADWPGFGGQFVLSAAVYWVGSLVLLAIGICQYFAADQKSRRIDRSRITEKADLNATLTSLQGQLGEITKELETLPGGPAFREQFARGADNLQLVLATALAGASDPSALESGLRELVAMMAHLASLYGPTGASTCYAYIMQFVAQPTNTECQLVHMVPTAESFDRSHGVLLTVPELSAKMDGHKDARVMPFALAAVPGNRRGENLATVFAPQAVLARKDVAGVSDVSAYSSGTSEVSAAASAAFAEARGGNIWAFGLSFISLPLCVPSGTEERDRIGVVTITSDGPNIMGGSEERWEIFWMMMRPYTDGIAVLLKLYLATKSN